jgi:predicted Zn-dependent peptidase
MIQSEYTSGSDDPEEVEYMARERILGAESLGRTAIGTPEAIRKLTVEELRGFDRKVYVPSNAVVALAGRLDEETLEQSFASWEGIERDRPGDPPEPHCQPGKEERVSKPDILFERVQRASCDLVFAYPAFGEGDPSLLAASMLRHVLHQRISERLRHAGTPLYDLWLHTHSYRREGIFFIGARVTGALVETVDIMYEEIRKMAREGPTGGETERAKEWNRTYLVQMLDRPDDYAARLAIEELYGTRLDPAAEWRMTDEIRKDDLREVAGKLLDPRSLTFCLMGNPGFREKRQIRRILREAARNGDT